MRLIEKLSRNRKCLNLLFQRYLCWTVRTLRSVKEQSEDLIEGQKGRVGAGGAKIELKRGSVRKEISVLCLPIWFQLMQAASNISKLFSLRNIFYFSD